MAKTTEKPDTPTTAIARVDLDPQALIASAIDKGAGIETLERLVALAKDVQQVRARQSWYEAMAQFQRACPKIKKTGKAEIRTSGGSSYNYTYAPLDEIMATILPVMGPLGLSVSYRVRFESGRVIAAARVSHDMGHSEESGEVSVPVSQAAMGATEPQRVGIASTYAKRYALLAIIGLAPEDDEDADGSHRTEIVMPRRISEKAGQVIETQTELIQDKPAADVWIGHVAAVDQKSGETKGRKWTLWTIVGRDGMELNTFSEKDAEFARESGGDQVRVEWEQTAKGGRKILSIGPHAD
jgi:hypothetical protein